MDERTQWLERLGCLNVNRNSRRGMAPHKPLLMLSVIDMVEAGSLVTPLVALSPELVFLFESYWDVVLDRQQNAPDVHMPFHALGGERDRLWQCLTQDGSPSNNRGTTANCQMDASLWNALQDPLFRKAVRERIVTIYFTVEERLALCARLGMTLPTDERVAQSQHQAAEWKASQKRGRDARFRTRVLVGYRFTCALTGYQLTTAKEHMVEAAHIHQRASSGNDNPENGLALTPDAHWLFDRGLWTVEFRGGRFVVRVASKGVKETSPTPRSILTHHGQELVFAAGTTLRPSKDAFEWHQEHRFVG